MSELTPILLAAKDILQEAGRKGMHVRELIMWTAVLGE